jgi:hypothetical protein
MGDVTTIFLEHGLLGACVLVLAGVVWRLYRAYAAVQNQRVSEAQAVTDRILEVSDKWMEAVSGQSEEIKGLGGKADSIEKRVCETLAALQQHDRDTRKGR